MSSSNGFRDTFLWQYLRQSYAAKWTSWAMVYFIMILGQVGRATLPMMILIPAGLIVLGLLLNYLAWQTVGRLLVSTQERSQLSIDDRAALAWSFWQRPARKPKI